MKKLNLLICLSLFFFFLNMVLLVSPITPVHAQWDNLVGDVLKRSPKDSEKVQPPVDPPDSGPSQNNPLELAGPHSWCKEMKFKNRDAVVCSFNIYNIQRVVYQYAPPWGDGGGTPIFVHQFLVESAGFDLSIDWFGEEADVGYRHEKFAMESCLQLAQSAKISSKPLKVQLVFADWNNITDKIQSEKKAGFVLIGSSLKDLRCEL